MAEKHSMTETTANSTTLAEAPFEETQLAEMPELTREMILNRARPLQQKRVAIPEWGGTVIVRELTGAERDRFEMSVIETNKRGDRVFNSRNMRAKLVALSVITANGDRMFADEDVATLGHQSAAALDRVYDVAARLSRISKQDEEELAKNSSDDRSGGLPTD